eukprot:4237252-Pyramimonas_sp.AAC.2
MWDEREKVRRLGWKSFWAPCAIAAKGGRSSGVAILFRAHLDAWQAPGHEEPLVPHRLIQAFFRTEVLGVVSVYCGHWKDGEGSGPTNLQIAKQLGDSVLYHALPSIAGGDRILEPSAFQE